MKNKKVPSTKLKDSHKTSLSKGNKAKKESRTVGDWLADFNDQWMETLIKSGQLFKIDYYDLIRLMDNTNRALLFERINQISFLDFAEESELDRKLVMNWLDRYRYCQILWKQSNKQFVSQATTNQQIVLYYYLKKLELIDIDIFEDSTHKSMILSVLLNRNYDNIRKALREADLKKKEHVYLTNSNLILLLNLAGEINYPALSTLIWSDIRRLKYL